MLRMSILMHIYTGRGLLGVLADAAGARIKVTWGALAPFLRAKTNNLSIFMHIYTGRGLWGILADVADVHFDCIFT